MRRGCGTRTGSVIAEMASQHLTAPWYIQKCITGTGMGFSQWCLVGEQETLAETGEVWAAFKKKFFPHKDNQGAGPGCGVMVLSPSLEDFQTPWDKALSNLV